MRKKHTTTIHLGVMFLFVSITAVPFSLRAAGINVSIRPKVNAVINAWGQIAGLFSGGYQPINVAEWSALYRLDEANLPGEAVEPESRPCRIACLNKAGDELEAEAPYTPPASTGQSRGAIQSRRSKQKFAFAATVYVNADEIKDVIEPIVAKDKGLLKRLEKRIIWSNLKANEALKKLQSYREVKWVFDAQPPAVSESGLRLLAPMQPNGSVERRRRARMYREQADTAPRNCEA